MKLAFLRVIVVFLIVVGTGLYNLTNKRIKKGDNAVLIELFTSQGCSSCPPADKLLKEIAENHPEGNVYVLSYHVDYWDRLGWKDPFSQKKFTEKQYSYAKAFKLNTVYTPQVIVNGDTEFVGSNRSKMTAAIAKYNELEPTASIGLEASRANNKITATFSTEEMKTDDQLIFALYIKETNTAIHRGENSGKELLGRNIVIAEEQTTLTEGKITLDIPADFRNEELGVLAYMRNDDFKVKSVSADNSIE